MELAFENILFMECISEVVFSSILLFIGFGFVFGILLIFSGMALVILSFRDEVINNKYVVEKSNGYVSNKKDLEPGEFSVTKDIEYVSNGRYKITYNIDYKQYSGNVLFADKSDVTIKP